MTRGRAARGPRERGVEIGHVDEVVTTQLLFGIRKGTIQNLRSAIHYAHSGRTRAWLEAAPSYQDTRVPKCLCVPGISRHPLFLLGLSQLGPTGLVPVGRRAGGLHYLS